jgi:glycosylphosphatidylinositol transamidase (GPIT) subunit GPI8
MQSFSHDQKDFEYPKLNERWGVVIGTSDDWANYRHQADALAMYQLLKRHGYDDEHIILIMEDNIAYHPRNIYPGVVKVRADGENLYNDVVVDYKISDISIDDFAKILMGDVSERLPHVVSSCLNDNIIVFWCGHGNFGKLAWGSKETVYGWQLNGILSKMNEAGKYRKILFSMDACYSGTIGEDCEGIPGVLFITAANANETSKADMKDPEMGIWLSNGFTRSFQETIDDNPNITMRDLYYNVARHTIGSHATVYNHTMYGNMFTNTMQEYLK